MDAKVTWSQGMSFTGTAETGFSVPLGSDPAVGGANDGFRPLELMAVSLAGCTAMDVISILRKKQQAVSGFEVQVQASQPETHPHVFTHAKIVYLVTGTKVDEAALVRAIQLSATKYCPAQAMLSKAFPMDLIYEIHEDGAGLVCSGEVKLA
ncbi:MAG: OsmC family protein [Chloroflexota bacterium]